MTLASLFHELFAFAMFVELAIVAPLHAANESSM
jgi:hypothetical protein